LELKFYRVDSHKSIQKLYKNENMKIFTKK